MATAPTHPLEDEDGENDKHVDLLQGLPSPLILGSASLTRKLILREMGIPYRIVVRPIDESQLGNRDTDPPKKLVHTLAHAKMDHLIREIQAGNCREELSFGDDGNDTNHECIVLTADQVVTCDGQILEKPRDLDQAKAFCARYGRHPCSTVGCVVLHHLPTNTRVSDWHVATLHFSNRLMADDQADQLVEALVSQGAPVLQCAGGLMVEHPLVRAYVERMDGTEDSVMGLSKATVRQLLRELRRKLAEKQEPSTAQQE